MVAFEAEARASQVALDELVASDAFKRLVEVQGETEGPTKTVAPLDADGKRAAAPPPGEALPVAEPGATYAAYSVTYPSVLDFKQVAGAFLQTAHLTIPYAEQAATAGEPARLKITLPGHNIFEMAAAIADVGADAVQLRVAAADAAFQNACAYPRTSAGQKRLASETEADRGPVKVVRTSPKRSSEDDLSLPIRRRLGRMSMEEKINLALSGDREERMALAQDGNKAVHHYLLRNTRLSTEEVAMMARLPTLNPDVLAKIAENPTYTQNPVITKNLVFNPRTPLKISTRLIDRLPRTDVQLIARRTGMHRALVAAAQKKLMRRTR